MMLMQPHIMSQGVGSGLVRAITSSSRNDLSGDMVVANNIRHGSYGACTGLFYGEV